MELESAASLVGKIGKPIKQVNPLIKDFREFAMRGNVVDLAVGVIIGAAFGKIVDALVTNVVMPPLSLITGGIDLSNRVLILSSKSYPTVEDAIKDHQPLLKYGVFLNAIINFLIVSFTIFVCVRIINKIHAKPAPPPDAPKKDCPFCLSSIPLAATRCPQCTSTLSAPSAPAKI